jgi:membrane protein YqaA with SNARE-associated domain
LDLSCTMLRRVDEDVLVFSRVMVHANMAGGVLIWWEGYLATQSAHGRRFAWDEQKNSERCIISQYHFLLDLGA